jgi:Lipopolysaccharide-assembly
MNERPPKARGSGLGARGPSARSAKAGLLLLLVPLASCGYRFTAPGGPLPQGIRAVRAPVFENATQETGAEVLFTQALREQLSRAGTLGGDAAEPLVRGVITSVAGGPLVSTPGRLPNYRLTAGARLTLVSQGKVLVTTDIAGAEDYPPGADVLLTEANRAAALRRLADTMMREGYERLCTGF